MVTRMYVLFPCVFLCFFIIKDGDVKIKELIYSRITEILGTDNAEEIEGIMGISLQESMGDFALPCCSFAKNSGRRGEKGKAVYC